MTPNHSLRSGSGQAPNHTLSQRLAHYAAGVRYEDLSAEVVHAAKQRMVDTLGCAVDGFDEPPARIARDVAAVLRPPSTRSAHSGPSRSTIWGTRTSTAADLAAFANGVAVRCLDFNDTYLSKEALHPSDTVAGLIAVAEAEGRGGRDLLAAIVLSYDVICALADAASIRDRGWDHTTYGVIPVALGAGVLMGLDVPRLAEAVNLAVASNTTLREIRVGQLSMWKGAAFANASRNGVFAAYLAREGMTGPPEVFEGPRGFFAQVSGPLDLNLAHTGGRSRILETLIKQVPAEYHAQAAIEAALAVRQRLLALNPSAASGSGRGAPIGAVEIHTYRVAVQIIGGEPEKWHPITRETADHSLPYLVAIALLDGSIGPAAFTPERFADPALHEFLQRVTVHEDPSHTARYPQTLPVRVSVRTDSREIVEEVEVPLGHPKRPMTDTRLERKFLASTVPPLPRARAKRLLSRLWRIESEDSLSEILQLCRITPRR